MPRRPVPRVIDIADPTVVVSSSVSRGDNRMYRCCVLTLNNYSEEDIVNLESLVPNIASYVVFNREVAPSTGTNHLQIYIELKQRKSLKQLKAIPPLGKCHIEARKGTQAEAVTYCKGFKKDGSLKEGSSGHFVEVGTARQQGARIDLDSCREMALAEGMRAVTRSFGAQAIKTASLFLTYNEDCRSWKPSVTWVTGATGTGKSLLAWTCLRGQFGSDVYHKKCGSRWWDGYDGHKGVVIDDFRGSWWKLTEMLSLLDRYPKMVEVKGGWRQFKPRSVFVTSILAPQDVYHVVELGQEPIQQLLRRIDRVWALSTSSLPLIIEMWKNVEECAASNELLGEVEWPCAGTDVCGVGAHTVIAASV